MSHVGPPVRAVLWDADGVLQHLAPSPDVAAVVGAIPGYLTDAGVDRARVLATIDRLGLGERRDEILAVWTSFDLLPRSLSVVAEVRATGTPCYLATNQDSYRADRMAALTPYAEALDGTYYSCHLGVAKPETGYFDHIARDLGLEPAALLFVDDMQVNVAGARAAGLRAEQWHHSAGTDALRAVLRRHGVLPGARDPHD